MSPPKLVLVAAVLVLLCAVALGFSARDDRGSIGDPSASRLSFLTGLLPQRVLAPDDVADADCFDAPTRSFLVAAAQTCTVAVPDGVKRIEARWSSGSAEAALTRDGSITQRYRATDDPQDPDHPGQVDMPVFGDGSVLAISCAGSGGCSLRLR
ncbi:MAG: hypothetical protein JWN61_2919 [Pseudonocardiales bacterium]|nr:hypothetical protein [Jatrophihabitantaceae bacterium]MCW2604784.1 hypothetical protein [Pseudonocardiales bacterium]